MIECPDHPSLKNSRSKSGEVCQVPLEGDHDLHQQLSQGKMKNGRYDIHAQKQECSWQLYQTLILLICTSFLISLSKDK